jgi:hypothetical protein
MKLFLKKIRECDYFSLGNAITLYYAAMFFLFPVLYLMGVRTLSIAGKIERGGTFEEPLIIITLMLGILAFTAGRTLFGKKPLSMRKAIRIDTPWLTKSFYTIFSGVLVASILVKIIKLLDGRYFVFPEILNLSLTAKYYLGFFEIFGWLSLALAFIWYFDRLKKGEGYRVWQMFAWVILVTEFLNGFLMNSNLLALKAIVIYAVVRHYMWKKSLIHFVVTLFISIAILLPIGNYFQWQSKTDFIALRNAGNTAVQTPIEALDSIPRAAEYSVDSAGRIDQTLVFSRIVRRTENFVHFKYLKNFFISLGPPRFMWKEKPIISFDANQFARDYQIIGDHDRATRVGPTIPGDLYMAFGVWGVVVGLLILGWVYEFVFRTLIRRPHPSLSGVLIYSLLLPDLIKGMENQTAPVLAGAVKLVIALYVVHIALTIKRK